MAKPERSLGAKAVLYVGAAILGLLWLTVSVALGIIVLCSHLDRDKDLHNPRY
jgi:hypothetical protein